MLTWSRVHGCNASENVTSKRVAASGRGRVGAVAGNHVIDCGHVNGVLRVFPVSCEREREPGRLTFAIAIRQAKISGAIQWTSGGPILVHAKPNSPMASSGAADRD